MMGEEKKQDAPASPDHLVTPSADAVTPFPLRAWFYLIWLSWQRQARAHLMIWIALGLLAFTILIVFLNARLGRWTMSHWRFPRGGPTYSQHLSNVETLG